jgi:hypothetical protein
MAATGRISATRAGLPRRPWLAPPQIWPCQLPPSPLRQPPAPPVAGLSLKSGSAGFLCRRYGGPLRWLRRVGLRPPPLPLRNARCRPPPRGPSSAPATGGRPWPSPRHSRLGGRRVATDYGRACCVRWYVNKREVGGRAKLNWIPNTISGGTD